MPRQLIEIVVLAAGLGTRMKSDQPKVLQPFCGQAILENLLRRVDAQGAVGTSRVARYNVVVGHGREKVMELVDGLAARKKISAPHVFTVQEKQLGTGHALKLALENSAKQKEKADVVLVLSGDLPLFSAKDLAEFVAAHEKEKSFATLASAVLKDAGAYGRVLRKGKNLVGVVEFKDATSAQRKIKEYNGGVYLFDAKLLRELLPLLGKENASGEYYLPDLFALAAKKKKKIAAYCFKDASVLAGVNTPRELIQMEREAFNRTAETWLDEGVFVSDPATTKIGPFTELAPGARVGAFTAILGDSEILSGAQVGRGCELIDVVVESGAKVRDFVVAEKARIGAGAAVGPMAQLRPGSVIGARAKIGNFVEIKESTIGADTAVSHLSYIGDASIGSRVNVGCGFVTCNYDGVVRDGKRKHRSIIGNDVFIGSDAQVVAPIEIADGTFIASGSTVTESVKEKDSLVLARSHQVTKPGYAKKYRSK